VVVRVCHSGVMTVNEPNEPREPNEPSGPHGPRPAARPGRRPASSRAAIEEAASELFLEQSYAGTTIEHITSRAGVSRATFFNYFGAKSDLLWGDVDSLVDSVESLLRDQPADLAPLEAVRAALIAAARVVGPDHIPLAVTQWESMGAREEMITSALARFSRLATLVRAYLATRSTPGRELADSAASFAIVGALAAAAEVWARQGTRRGPLAPVIAAAIGPVCDGFARDIHRTDG
jgi:AcrR family transcriptional regulator